MINLESAPPVEREYSDLVQILSLVIGIPAVLFGSIGNLLTILAVIKSPKLRTNSNVFVVSLAVADLICCCVTIPTLITVYVNSAWVLGNPYCRFFSVFYLETLGAILFLLAATACSRFLKIVHPTLFSKLLGRKWKVCLFISNCWITPIWFLLPAILELWGELGYDKVTMVCTFVRGEDNKSYNTFLITTAVVVPMAIIAFCYLQILRKIRVNRRRVAHMRQHQHASEHGPERNELISQREDIRYSAMMACIFLVFLVCYCPYLINLLIDPYCDNLSADACTAMCQWFSNCLHPLVYVVMNRHFRKAFANILRASSVTMSTSSSTQVSTSGDSALARTVAQ